MQEPVHRDTLFISREYHLFPAQKGKNCSRLRVSRTSNEPLGGRSRQKLTTGCPENTFTLRLTADNCLLHVQLNLNYCIFLLKTRNQDKIAYFSFLFLFWCLSHHLVRNTDPGAMIAATWIQSNSVLFLFLSNSSFTILFILTAIQCIQAYACGFPHHLTTCDLIPEAISKQIWFYEAAHCHTHLTSTTIIS